MAREAGALLFLALCWCPHLPVGCTNEVGIPHNRSDSETTCNHLISPRGNQMGAGRFAIRPIVRYSHLVGAPNGEVRAPTESQKQKSSRLTGHREERDMAFDRSFVMH